MVRRTSYLLAALTFLTALVFGCSFRSPDTVVRIRWAGPAYPAGFQCVGVVVTGDGISTQDNQEQNADWQNIYDGGLCPYPGISTVTQPLVSDLPLSFSLSLPSGQARTIQILAVATTGSCPTQTISELIVANRRRALPSGVTGI